MRPKLSAEEQIGRDIQKGMRVGAAPDFEESGVDVQGDRVREVSEEQGGDGDGVDTRGAVPKIMAKGCGFSAGDVTDDETGQ